MTTREAIAPSQLETFLNTEAQRLPISIYLVRRLSPDSLSVMEFRSKTDIDIAEKMMRFPILGENVDKTWRLSLTAEFHMTSDSSLFKTTQAPQRLPLYEGKMIHQFTSSLAEPRYWLDEQEARQALLGRTIADDGRKLVYQGYRLGFRAIARNTDSRTLIVGPIPRNVFCGNSILVLNTANSGDVIIKGSLLIAVQAILNSLTVDYYIRQMVSANINMFYIYQLPVPRLTEKDAAFAPIVERAAKLICTTPEYDELAREVGLGNHTAGVTEPAERNQLRAELDAMVAHLYGLSEAELTHILGSFPLVEQAQKDAVLTEYRRQAPHPDDAQLAALIADGESERVEFKVAALWNPKTNQKDGSMRENVVQGVAAFLNSAEGGTLILGVENATNRVVGLASDYAAANPQKNDRDGYELWLRDAIGTSLGQAVGVYYCVSFHSLGGAEVCRIVVRPAASPAYYNGDLYVRIGNGKKKLSAQQAMEYVKQRWAKS